MSDELPPIDSALESIDAPEHDENYRPARERNRSRAKSDGASNDTLAHQLRARLSRPRVPGEPSAPIRRLRAVPTLDPTPVPDDEPGDYTKLILRRRNRRLVTVGATVVGVAVFATLFLIPLRSWMHQREQIELRQREATSLDAANRQLEAENARLQTEEGFSEAATDMNLGEPGAVSLDVKVEPLTIGNMPAGWPFSMVRGIVQSRIDAATPTTTAPTIPATTPFPGSVAPTPGSVLANPEPTVVPTIPPSSSP